MAGRLRRKKAAVPQAQRPKTASGQNGSSATVLLAGTDTALRLLDDIRNRRLDPRDLTPSQRRSCLMLLANGSQTSTELSALFRCSASTIRMDLKQIREEVGREVREWSTAEVVGQLALVAEKTTAQAMKQDDPGLAWTIQRDLAKLLKELGVIRPEVDQAGFRLTVESIGSGYDRARQALSQALNPALTGMQPRLPGPVPALRTGGQVIDVDHESREPGLAVPQTPLPASGSDPDSGGVLAVPQTPQDDTGSDPGPAPGLAVPQTLPDGTGTPGPGDPLDREFAVPQVLPRDPEPDPAQEPKPPWRGPGAGF